MCLSTVVVFCGALLPRAFRSKSAAVMYRPELRNKQAMIFDSLRVRNAIWKSFPNHPHDVPPDSLRLAKSFLAANLSDVQDGQMLVGDDQDGVYYAADSAEAEFVAPNDRVFLPNLAVAQAWGRPAFAAAAQLVCEETMRMEISGVEFVCRIPREYGADSRIVVLFGGRGWSGSKTLKVFRFGSLADRKKAFLLSPSFREGEYWNPETGTGNQLAAALAELQKRYGLRKFPVVLYGYSAGGQCAALFSHYKGLSVAAWGAHGCGVFPVDVRAARMPALVTCGFGDEDRLRISRSFAMRYREAGRILLFKPLPGGHGLGEDAKAIAREWLMSILEGGESWIWGEDDTLLVREKEDIEQESRNPLYTRRLAELWQRR